MPVWKIPKAKIRNCALGHAPLGSLLFALTCVVCFTLFWKSMEPKESPGNTQTHKKREQWAPREGPKTIDRATTFNMQLWRPSRKDNKQKRNNHVNCKTNHTRGVSHEQNCRILKSAFGPTGLDEPNTQPQDRPQTKICLHLCTTKCDLSSVWGACFQTLFFAVCSSLISVHSGMDVLQNSIGTNANAKQNVSKNKSK